MADAGAGSESQSLDLLGALDGEIYFEAHAPLEDDTVTRDERLDALRRFKNAGCYTGVLAMPLLPEISDRDEHLDALFERVEVSCSDEEVDAALEAAWAHEGEAALLADGVQRRQPFFKVDF